MQLEVGGGAQLPVPLQWDTEDSVEPEQVVLPQATVVAPCVHAPAPSQTPLLPQGGFSGHPVSLVPAGALAHDPWLPATLHAWQVGQAATPQQMPLVQKLEAHSLVVVHVEPVAFLARQLPPAPVQ